MWKIGTHYFSIEVSWTLYITGHRNTHRHCDSTEHITACRIPFEWFLQQKCEGKNGEWWRPPFSECYSLQSWQLSFCPPCGNIQRFGSFLFTGIIVLGQLWNQRTEVGGRESVQRWKTLFVTFPGVTSHSVKQSLMQGGTCLEWIYRVETISCLKDHCWV